MIAPSPGSSRSTPSPTRPAPSTAAARHSLFPRFLTALLLTLVLSRSLTRPTLGQDPIQIQNQSKIKNTIKNKTKRPAPDANGDHAVSPTSLPLPSPGGGTLRIALADDPRSLDPRQLFSAQEGTLAWLLFQPLIDTDPKTGQLAPVLVESLPETSPDGRIYTFRLRRGIRFSNGDPLTSRDVVVTFERFFDPEVSPNPSDFASIEGGLAFADARLKERSAPANNDRKPGTRWIEPTTVPGVEAPDDFTIRIRLTQPDLAFLPQLSKQCVVPRLAAGAGMAFGTRPIGSGPLVLRRWDRGTRMRFERNPHYSPPSQPRPDAVEVQIGITGETQAMMFERGELDLLDGLNGPDFLRFRRDPRMSPTLRVVRETSARYVALNCELPPFTNRWVRQALNHAVNREALVRAISGRAGVAPGPVASVITERHPSLPRYAHDPARARELLRLAGWPNGFSSVLWVMRGAPIEVRMAQILQQSLRDIGVNIQIKETSFAAFWDSISRRREVPMALTGWTPDFNDPKNPLSLFDADNIHDEGSLNPCFYANPAVQTLFRAANVEVQPARRFERLREAERLIVEDAPAIFLVHLHAESAIQPWVRDYVPGGFWPTVRIENCWIAP